MSNVKTIVYGAAKVGHKRILANILTYDYGREVYEMYSKETLSPAEVARKCGHPETADYIMQLEQR